MHRAEHDLAPACTCYRRLLVRGVLVAWCLLLLVSCATEETDQKPPHLVFRQTELLVIGADEEAEPSMLLGRPVHVRTDHAGNIYIADTGFMTVKVFDARGDFIRNIGARGKGPGEFSDITAMHVDHKNEVIVADQFNRRITRFDSNGEVISVQSIASETMRWPRDLQQAGPNEYMFLYPGSINPYVASDNVMLTHTFNETFDHKKASLIPFSFYPRHDLPVTRYISQLRPGSFTIASDHELFYAPYLYEGEIYRYVKTDSLWSQEGTIRGFASRSALTPIEIEEDEPKGVDMVIHLRGDRFGAELHNTSNGIYKLNDGRLAHFVTLELGEERVAGVELYDTSYNLIAFVPIDDLRAPTEEPAPVYQVKWKDAEDRFYVIDSRPYPVLSVVTLDFIALPA